MIDFRNLLYVFTMALAVFSCKPRAFNEASSLSAKETELQALYKADQASALDITKIAHEDVAKVLSAKQVDPATFQSFTKALDPLLVDCRSDVVDTPLLHKTRDVLKAQNVSRFRSLFKPNAPDIFSLLLKMDCWDVRVIDVGGISAETARFYFKSYDELQSMKKFEAQTRWLPGKSYPGVQVIEHCGTGVGSQAGFLQSLALGFEFVDINELLVVFSNGANIFQERQLAPNCFAWNLYDFPAAEPQIVSWKKALQSKKTDILSLVALASGGRIKSEYRGVAVRAGGDETYKGQPDCDQRYARVTKIQAEALKTNPYLDVDVQADPLDPSGNRTALVRYFYPSAHGIERFKSKLKPATLSAYQAALRAGELKEENTCVRDAQEFHITPKYEAVTRAIITDLIENANAQKSDPTTLYQNMVSIHAFRDFNGRSTRLQRNALDYTNPFFMVDWDYDTYSRRETLLEFSIIGTRQLKKIWASLQAENDRKPSGADFYGVAMPYMVAARVDELPENLKGTFVQRMKSFFQQTKNKDNARSKRNLQLYLDIQREIFGKSR